MGELRVKPLEWRDSEAETPFGTTYMIHDTTAFLGDASYDLWMRGCVEDGAGFFLAGDFATWNEASDAAQADHEARIRSALASPDTASVVSEDQHRDQSSPRQDDP